MAVHTVVPLPHVPQVIPFPSPEKKITQEQLRRIIALRNQVAALTKDLEAAEDETQTALESGVPVEPGIHVASLKESFRRNIGWREIAERLGDRLYGDGKGYAYCENVLGNTKPSRTVSLVIS